MKHLGSKILEEVIKSLNALEGGDIDFSDTTEGNIHGIGLYVNKEHVANQIKDYLSNYNVEIKDSKKFKGAYFLAVSKKEKK